MAISQNPYVYMETVEETENKGEESTENRSAGRLGISVCVRQLLKSPCTERYARWCERTQANHSLLLDYPKSDSSLL